MRKIEIAIVAGVFALLMALSLTSSAEIVQVWNAPATAAAPAAAADPDLPAARAKHLVHSRRYRAQRTRPHARHARAREQRAARS